MKMTANLNRPALYWGWSIAGAISLYILVFEVTEHLLNGRSTSEPDFLWEILMSGMLMPILLGVLLTGLTYIPLAAIKTEVDSTNRSRKMTSKWQKRILVVENELLLGASIEHLLKNEADFCVWGVTSTDVPTLVEEIIRIRPDVVILEEVRHPIEPAKLLILLKEIPRLRLIVVSAEDDVIQIYDKDQFMATQTADLVTIIHRDSSLPYRE